MTRPAVLAAAALLVAGGALAAVRTVSSPTPRARAQPEPPAQQAPQPQATPAAPAKATASPAAGPGAQPTPPASFKGGSAEYGYTSPHTAYAVDRGLRLETETHVTQVKAGTPHRVTVTLQNLTDQHVVLYAPRGCAVAVGAFSQDEQGAGERSGACAGSGDDPRAVQTSREPEAIRLQPHGRLVSEATLVLDRPGTWYVVAYCLYFERAAASPAPTPTPAPTPQAATGTPSVVPSGQGGQGGPVYERSRGWEPWYGDWRALFTPPIRMEATP